LPRHPRVGIGHARNSKVEDLGLAFLVNQDIFGLQITVNDSALMGMIYGIADLRHQCETSPQVEMILFGELHQRQACNELHCEIRLCAEAGVGSSGFVDLSYPGMLQATKRVGLTFESTQQLGAHKPRLDHFESDDPVGLLLLGEIDASHAAFAKQANNAIVADHYGMTPRSAVVCVGPNHFRAWGSCGISGRSKLSRSVADRSWLLPLHGVSCERFLRRPEVQQEQFL
jgi:hypothetical protein